MEHWNNERQSFFEKPTIPVFHNSNIPFLYLNIPLSKELGIPQSQVEIIKGQRSREKTLSISDIKNWAGIQNSSQIP